MSSSHAASLLSVKLPSKTMALFAGVEKHWVVLLGVVMPAFTSLLAADFAKLAWVRFHPAEDIFLPRRLEGPVVTG
jgi:hypothetical protein